MTLLITGANGFLGKHVMEELRRNNVEFFAPNSSQLNLTNWDDVLIYFDSFKPDKVLHMAALCGGILANKNSPADFIHVNTKMTSNIFDAVKQFKVEFLYTLGSVCSYPEHCPVPFKEDDIWNGYPEPTNAPYGMSKRLQLSMQQAYRRQYGLKGAHLIPVNMYGPFDHFDLVNSHVIPALIRKFLDAKNQNKPTVECWGTGEATREFLYAGDCAKAIGKAIINNFDSGLPINLGTGKSISIKSLSELIAALTGYTGQIIFTGEVSDGQPKRQLNVDRARELLGFTAETTLTEGLIKTIDWYKKVETT